MRGLFLKIFAIFWLAQSLIFIISTTLILREHFPGPSWTDAFDATLKHNATLALHDFETSGCDSFRVGTSRFEPSGSALLSSNGQLLCSTTNAPAVPALSTPFPNHVDGRTVHGLSLWLIPITATNGTHYEYIWFQPHSTKAPPQRRWAYLHFAFPQLPVAIAVGGLTTFILVLLFTRPLVRMRKAARALAHGDLTARVEQSPSAASQSTSDEFQGLVHDFNHMAERLESLVDAQKLLLRDVSHELRSPLARLSVALEMAREDGIPQSVDTPQTDGTSLSADTAQPALEAHLNRIEREAAKLNQLIGQLLTLSSLEARENTSAFEPVSLNQLCRQLLPDAEYEAQQHNCTVTLVEENQCTIRGNPDLLYRAIENVVRNAIRYTDPNTEVSIRIFESTPVPGQLDTRQYASIEVTDHGPGVPEAELAQIFRPFYRVDQARSSHTGGFGVGLAITERAVRLHGGTIRATNHPTGGTSILFLFPLVPEAA